MSASEDIQALAEQRRIYGNLGPPGTQARSDTARHALGFDFPSTSGSDRYVIAWDVLGRFWNCSCKAGINRGICKHLKRYARKPTRADREAAARSTNEAAAADAVVRGRAARRSLVDIQRDLDQEEKDRKWALAVLRGEKLVPPAIDDREVSFYRNVVLGTPVPAPPRTYVALRAGFFETRGYQTYFAASDILTLPDCPDTDRLLDDGYITADSEALQRQPRGSFYMTYRDGDATKAKAKRPPPPPPPSSPPRRKFRTDDEI